MHAVKPWLGVLISIVIPSIGFMDSGSAADTEAAQEPVTVDLFGQGKLVVPPEFKPVPPKSRIVEYEFAVGEADPEQIARVTMMTAGGDVKANIRRWKGQFAGGDKTANKTEELTIGQWQVHVVDLNGVFAERMGGGPFAGGKVVQRQDYAMTGVIIVPPQAGPQSPKYFVKMIGPAAIVKANRERLLKMIKSIDQS